MGNKKSSQLGCEDSGWSAVSGIQTHFTQSEGGNYGTDKLRGPGCWKAGRQAKVPLRRQAPLVEHGAAAAAAASAAPAVCLVSSALLLHSQQQYHHHRAELTDAAELAVFRSCSNYVPLRADVLFSSSFSFCKLSETTSCHIFTSLPFSLGLLYLPPASFPVSLAVTTPPPTSSTSSSSSSNDCRKQVGAPLLLTASVQSSPSAWLPSPPLPHGWLKNLSEGRGREERG